MTLQELKNMITSNKLENVFIIFKCSENDFVASQYYREIAKNKNLDIEVIEDIHSLINATKDIFGTYDLNATLKVFKTDIFDATYQKLKDINNLIIVCNKLDKDSNSIFKDYVIDVPKLEDWQIKDYVYSILDGVPVKQLDWMIAQCNNDIYRIQLEIDKLNIFGGKEKSIRFKEFVEDGALGDLSQITLNDLFNAITHRDIEMVKRLYPDIDKLGLNGMAFSAMLYNNFKNIINVQLGINASAESCGMKPNQFWAIKKYSTNFYTKDQLIKIFEIISDIENQVRMGNFPAENIIDYLLIKIFSV